MAWAPIAVNDVVELVHRARVNDQALYFTHHYKVLTITGTPPPLNVALDELHQDLDGAAKLYALLAAVYGSNVVITDNASLQKIYPTRYAKVLLTPSATAGTAGSECEAQNVSLPLTVTSTQATRHDRGVKRLGGIPEDFIENGYIDPAFRAGYVDVGVELLRQPNTATGTVVWQPILWDRVLHIRTDVIAQGSSWKLGTMRRRTVGRGI